MKARNPYEPPLEASATESPKNHLVWPPCRFADPGRACGLWLIGWAISWVIAYGWSRGWQRSGFFELLSLATLYMVAPAIGLVRHVESIRQLTLVAAWIQLFLILNLLLLVFDLRRYPPPSLPPIQAFTILPNIHPVILFAIGMLVPAFLIWQLWGRHCDGLPLPRPRD